MSRKVLENPYKKFIEDCIKLKKKEEELKEQMTLDYQKWLESEMENEDLSGKMCYCNCCDHRCGDSCGCTQEDRLKNRLCYFAAQKVKSI